MHKIFFDITNSLGDGTPLVILFGAEVQFSGHFWKLEAKLLVLDKNVVPISSIIFARSTTLHNKIFIESIVWPENPNSHF